jgi:ATP-dependent helicase HrpB
MACSSPAYRPVQVTGDLASFWKSAYFEVRKDLRTLPQASLAGDPLLRSRCVAKRR